jgi:carbamate kinase
VRPQGVPSAPAPDGAGFRRVVASPRPTSVLEERAVADLLVRHHVVAGGGGGIALAASAAGHVPRPAVIDKDFVASLLARLARGEFAPGSMAPKVLAAAEFAEATGRCSVISPLGGVAAALRGEGGTRVAPA